MDEHGARRPIVTDPEHEPPDTPGYTSTPPCDPDKYRVYLEDTELTEDQQRQYLKTLWSIMATFVELGFGLDSVQRVIPAPHETGRELE
jgi:hypothetical protein